VSEPLLKCSANSHYQYYYSLFVILAQISKLVRKCMKYFDTLNFKNTFSICFIAGIVLLFSSFVGFLVPAFREVMFFVVLLSVLILSIYKLEYGLFAALGELVLGSKGYLLYFEADGTNVSLRIGIFLVVMGVFFSHLLIKKFKTIFYSPSEPRIITPDKSGVAIRGEPERRVEGSESNSLVPSPYKLFWFIPLFVLNILGFFHGLFRGFGFKDVFLDANGYFYLLYIFPFLAVFRDKEKSKRLTDVLLSSGFVLAIFSLFLFYIFSREWLNLDLIYKWQRVNLLSEITFTSGVYRIFAQSQIFLLVIFFLSLNYFFSTPSNLPLPRGGGGKVGEGYFSGEKFHLAIIASFFSLAAIFVSLSRSFFLGFLAGLFVFLFIVYLKNKKESLRIFFVVVLICFASVAFLWTINKNEPRMLANRFLFASQGNNSSDPASLTRQEELKPLFLEIIKKPFLGWGFGKTVEFLTHDPRALNMLPQCVGKESCLYKTYAFEWGYLDLWLKLGLFGLVSLFGILYSLFKRGWSMIQAGNFSPAWILSSLVAVCITNIFTPYLNHPLGLGILILITIYLFTERFSRAS